MNFNQAKMHETITPGEALKLIRDSQGLSQNDELSLPQTFPTTRFIKIGKMLDEVR